MNYYSKYSINEGS